MAHALEALSLIAERDTVQTRWQTPRFAPLKYARRCYGHLAGELGVALYRTLLNQKHLATHPDGHLALTKGGHAWLAALGVEVSGISPSAAARFAYPCMDWSERQDHLAGALAKTLLQHFLEKRWITLQIDSRALTLTAQGKRALRPKLMSA